MTTLITGASQLISGYDALICDVWGVIHDGHTAYDGAGDTLARFRKSGGTVLLLSNAPMPSAWVACSRFGITRSFAICISPLQRKVFADGSRRSE